MNDLELPEWHDLNEVKKGDIGEEIVEKRLINKGWFLYVPVKSGSHPIDRLYIGKDYKVIMVDAKCKELRRDYPDTGFPLSNYETYKCINKSIDVLILFVDYVRGEIYGNYLNELEKKVGTYP